MNRIIADSLAKHGIDYQLPPLVDANLVEFFHRVGNRYAASPAFSSLGYTLSYDEFLSRANQFTRYLQNHTDLVPGDRIAIQMPNLIQYPVVLFGALQAGLVVVNTNPLYTARELEHQLNDSGARAVVALANVARPLESVIARTPVERVILTEVADLHSLPQRLLINTIARYVKRAVPTLNFTDSISLLKALALGGEGDVEPVTSDRNDTAILQYTGGTTGIAKGAELSHGNLLSNVVQSSAMLKDNVADGDQHTLIMPLPLYHIYSFLNSLLMMQGGHHSVLIPDPRDTQGLIKTMGRHPMSVFVGINTLFVSLMHHPEFRKLDFSNLQLTLSGGMALTTAVAEEWFDITGCEVNQGYGLTETSPVVAVNPMGSNRLGTIGLPVPGTRVKLVDANGAELSPGEPGELCIKGPQVMKSYWQRPEATAEVIDSEGWFSTGDIAVMEPDGYLRIVDRKKDMILVSGFNVYPNEVEDVVTSHPAVIESAAIGVPSDSTGEAIRMFVVVREPVSAQDLIAFCRERLAGYKVPRQFEFVDQLPKSNVGKVLRRELKGA